MQSKLSVKEDGVVSFNSKDNANIFCRFFSNLADSLLQKLYVQKINMESKLLNSIISIFEVNVRILFFAM